MTRQQRRKLERAGIDVGVYQRLVKEITKEVLEYTVKQYSTVVALCLRDELGFGNKRAMRFLGKVDEVFASVQDGYLTLDDIEKTVEEELNIAFG